jgi:hypothetical protein
MTFSGFLSIGANRASIAQESPNDDHSCTSKRTFRHSSASCIPNPIIRRPENISIFPAATIFLNTLRPIFLLKGTFIGGTALSSVTFLLLCGFAKFEGQSIFDGEGWVLDGFILGRNWQWCQLKVFPQGNVDFPIDSRRVVLSFLRCRCCWSSLRLVEDYGPNWWHKARILSLAEVMAG